MDTFPCPNTAFVLKLTTMTEEMNKFQVSKLKGKNGSKLRCLEYQSSNINEYQSLFEAFYNNVGLH